MSENIEKIVTLENDDNTLRETINNRLNEYREKNYKSSITATNSNYYFNIAFVKDDKMTVIISAHNLNIKNFWWGEWLSWWDMVKKGNEVAVKVN